MSWHIIEGLITEEFDVTTCQEMKVDHAFVVSMQLLWPGDERPVRSVPIALKETWPDTARDYVAKMTGSPAPYAGLSNRLPRTRATLDRGASVYAANCASCHGPTGWGDGPAGRKLSPPPADLAWLLRMPMSQWDGFMYWTVADGGAPSGTTVPAHAQRLSKDGA